MSGDLTGLCLFMTFSSLLIRNIYDFQLFLLASIVLQKNIFFFFFNPHASKPSRRASNLDKTKTCLLGKVFLWSNASGFRLGGRGFESRRRRVPSISTGPHRFNSSRVSSRNSTQACFIIFFFQNVDIVGHPQASLAPLWPPLQQLPPSHFHGHCCCPALPCPAMAMTP